MNDALNDTLSSRVGYLVPLNKLAPDRQARLLEQSEVIELKKKDTLFKQGDRDDYTFYVLEGELEMFADESLIKRVSGGEGASFQPLAQLQPRQMSAVARTKARVLRIKRSLLEQLLSMDDAPSNKTIVAGVEVEEMESSQSTDWLMTLLQSELFTRIPPSNIQGLLDTLETITVKSGEDIVKQGEPGDYYYAVQHGTCEVFRAGANRRPIRLAELGPGDTFGEEALISGARRNATVRMTSDGELARLTKDDFARLIKAPLLNVVSRAQADQAIAAGARWLDVRFEDEHSHNGLPGSLNIPLGMLRTRMDELDPAHRYIAYCDTGGRSSAAAFLLAEKGYEVCYVEGGAVSEPAADEAQARAPARVSAPAAPPPAPPAAAERTDSMLEAAVRASSLGAEVEKAAITIQQAQKMMAEAEAMKAEAERIVAAKLERERAALAREHEALQLRIADAARLEQRLGAERKAAEAASLQQQQVIAERAAAIEREAETRLAEQQERVEREAEVLEHKLAEAERLQHTLAEQQRHAEETRRQHDELQRRTEELKASTEQRLIEQQQKIEREAELLGRKLAEAERLKLTLTAQQEQAAAEAALHHDEVEQRLVALEHDARERLRAEEQRLEALYNKQAEQLESLQAGREAELRELLRRELATERANFEMTVSRTNEELEQAREERAAALAAKEAAAAEAARVIDEFKAAQQTLVAEQQAAFNAERLRLREEAARIERLREEAAHARRDAETVKAAAERELAEARARRVEAPELSVANDIVAIEQRASAAGAELQQALAAETAAASAARQNEDALERTYDTANEINSLLQKELDQWVGEQDRMQETTLQRAILSRQKEMVERIRARAVAAKAQSIQHDRSLIDEIQAQLGD